MTEQDRLEDYLGDGVYVHFDGYQIWVKTQEGAAIALEPDVLVALNRYWERVKAHYAKKAADAVQEP